MKKVLLSIFAFSSYFTFALTPGYLGVSIGNYATETTKGAKVTDVIENSAAEQFGIKENDVILSVDNVATTSSEMLVKQITSHAVNDKVLLTYLRNGVTYSNAVLLGEKPEAIYYKISIEEKAEGIFYTFTDDKLSIQLNTDGKTPKSVTQTLTDGTTKSWSADKSYLNKLYTQFSGIQDKISAIIKLNKQQGTCNCHCKNFNFAFYKIDKKEETAAVKTSISSTQLNVFPNPSSGKFTVDIISADKGAASISIIDINGREVYAETLNSFDGKASQTIELYNQAKGVYIVQVKIGDKLYNKKMVLQ